MRRLLVLVNLWLSAAAAGQQTTADADRLIESARSAMEAGQFEEAAALYEQLGEMMPERAELPFNQGVARYRLGAWDEAAKLFERAGSMVGNDELRAKAAYNLGNSVNQAARQAIDETQSDPQAIGQKIEDAIERLRDSVQHYKRTLGENTVDPDARANAEKTHRLIRQLEELQEQMQNQQQQQQEQQQQEQQDQQQSQDQQQQEQEQQNQETQDQESQEQQQQQEQRNEQGEDQQQQQQQEDQPDPREGDQEQQSEQEQQPAPGRQQEEPQPRMSREQLERLLQQVRDRDQQRREALAAQERAKYRPAEKDW